MVQFASLAQSPFGFEMSAKTTKSKLFGKLASIPKSTFTFLSYFVLEKHSFANFLTLDVMFAYFKLNLC